MWGHVGRVGGGLDSVLETSYLTWLLKVDVYKTGGWLHLSCHGHGDGRPDQDG